MDNGSCTIVGKTNFYFEYFINGCHTFDAVSKIYEVRIYICGLLIVMVCIQPLAAVFHGGISPDKIYESVMTYNQSNRLNRN